MVTAFVALLLMKSPLVPVLDRAPGCTPLQHEVLAGNHEAVQRLTGRRLLGLAKPSTPIEERGLTGSCFRLTALMLAAKIGEQKIAQILINNGASITPTASLPELGDTDFDARCLALANAQGPLIALLDEAGALPGPCTENARLLLAVSSMSRRDVARQLGANPTPQMLEAAMGSVIGRRSTQVLDLLVEAGLQQKLDFERTYDRAIGAGDFEMVNTLSSAGARVKGGYLLSRAIGGRHASMMSSLIAAGARTESLEAQAAILEAVRDRQGPVLRALMSAGYRGDQETPLLLHAVRHFPEIVPAMVQAGVGVEIDDDTGATPLMAAAEREDVALLNLLLERGASVRSADITCATAADVRLRKKPSAQGLEAVRKLVKFDEPIVPGRAARRMGVTCGSARLSITFDPAFEVFLPTGHVPMRPSIEYRLDPGLHELRVRQISDGAERKMTVTLTAGPNSFTEKFFDFARKKADP